MEAGKLKEEEFWERKVGLNKKGYATIEDFIRMLNFTSGKPYRKRDLVLIWKRITDKDRISFDEMAKILC